MGNGAAECLGQCLMAQADPEHGFAVVPAPADEINADARISRRTGAGRDEDPVTGRRQFPCFFSAEVVIAYDGGLCAQFLEVADQRINKAVVVVDYKDAGTHCVSEPPIVESVRGARKLNSENHGKT